MARQEATSETGRTRSDTELVKRIQGGERELLGELAERYLSSVYNRIVRVVPPSDVDDLTQETMLAIVRSVGRFGGRSSVATWVHAIVNNKLKYYYRQRAHGKVKLQWETSEDDEADGPPIPQNDGNPLERVMAADERGAVARIVNGLRPSYQQVLRLRFTDELEFRDVGQAMGLSLDAAKSLFRRAVAEVAKELLRLKGKG